MPATALGKGTDPASRDRASSGGHRNNPPPVAAARAFGRRFPHSGTQVGTSTAAPLALSLPLQKHFPWSPIQQHRHWPHQPRHPSMQVRRTCRDWGLPSGRGQGKFIIEFEIRLDIGRRWRFFQLGCCTHDVADRLACKRLPAFAEKQPQQLAVARPQVPLDRAQLVTGNRLFDRQAVLQPSETRLLEVPPSPGSMSISPMESPFELS